MANLPLPRISVFEQTDKDGKPNGKFDWRLLAGNGQTIASSANQGYESVQRAKEMARRILKDAEFKDAPIYIPAAD